MKVCVLGAGGFVGKHLIRNSNWVGITRNDLNLEDQDEVEKYFNTNIYDVVIHCAVVGGSRLKKDKGDVIWKNILMFENVIKVFKGKLIYFSSGAALRGTPPTDPYGLSKWIIDKRIDTIPNAYSLRIWGCYGENELSTRFSAVCKREGHVVIDQDRYFDFIDIEDVKKIVQEYVTCRWVMPKLCNLVYPEKLLLSQWAERFGATWEVLNMNSLGESYVSIRN
jgi:dTDP-4-dehydrorhamnose reductase|tara:strand:+ start:2174 stop:2842 length:669 start_codon:yes stop_codon:yes gene_type:complete